jgi:hypothetical protein
MAKRSKPASQVATLEERSANSPSQSAESSAISSPQKRPTLLAISVVLFALWFTFLLVTALTG